VAGSGFDVVPEQVREVGQAVVRLSQDVSSIVSEGAATIKLAGSATPASSPPPRWRR
jgi:hypothetical protein